MGPNGNGYEHVDCHSHRQKAAPEHHREGKEGQLLVQLYQTRGTRIHGSHCRNRRERTAIARAVGRECVEKADPERDEESEGN